MISSLQRTRSSELGCELLWPFLPRYACCKLNSRKSLHQQCRAKAKQPGRRITVRRLQQDSRGWHIKHRPVSCMLLRAACRRVREELAAYGPDLLCRDQARKEHATELRKAKDEALKASKARTELGEPSLSMVAQ